MNDKWKIDSSISNNLSDFRYVEWKYFSFKSNEISGFFCYSIGNPRNILGLRLGIISYAIHYKGRTDVGQFVIDGKDCDISKERVWIFDKFIIRKKEGDKWNITGESDDLTWNLTVKNISWGGEHRYKINHEKWMGWSVFSNLASVEGNIRIKDNDISVRGSGYYDTNYGNCKFSKNPWHWIRIDDFEKRKPMALTLFELRDVEGEGNMHLSIENKTYSYNSSDYTLEIEYKDGFPEIYNFKLQDDVHDIKLNMCFKSRNKHLLKLRLFKIVTMLKLYIIDGEYDMEIILNDEKHKFKGTGIAEYPVKTIF